MDPIEINAGTWYLRALRADDRIDDRHAVLASAQDPAITRWHRRPEPTLDAAATSVAERGLAWADERACSWAVCEPTTGEMLGEIVLELGSGELTCWALAPGRERDLLADTLPTVMRFAFGGLGLDEVRYSWTEGDADSARLADRCGFTVVGHDAAQAADGLVTAVRRADGGA